MKLASLFDGIGGFPLAATLNGIEPVWASEIDKNCIKVTRERFSNMKHYGSVTEIKGNEVEPVDVITFGSPCQDLSVAGKRAGLDGARSGLFMEAIRIIKEMRDVRSESTGVYRTNMDSIQPRYAVWENVPGAFSSNGGEDYRVVIESLAKIKDPTVSIPKPQKWEPAGLVEGNGWSLAWRVLDAQFWGVPQCRKRVFIIADFGGNTASEIFFERESLRWHPTQSGGQRQEVAGGIESGVRAAAFKPGQGAKAHGIGCAEEQSPTLGAEAGTLAVFCIQGNIIDRSDTTGANGCGVRKNVSYTLNTIDRPGVFCVHATQDPITTEERAHSLSANASQAIMRFQRSDQFVEDTKSSPLAARDYKDGRDLVVNSSVRRLTPLECTRLQGFPDWWFDGTDLSDAAKYKALGNSVAIPCVDFVLGCIAKWEAKA